MASSAHGQANRSIDYFAAPRSIMLGNDGKVASGHRLAGEVKPFEASTRRGYAISTLPRRSVLLNACDADFRRVGAGGIVVPAHATAN